MKVFVTGVGGQLGHDVMNELARRGCEGIGSDLAGQYSGAADGTAVTIMPYVPLDITDREAVGAALADAAPDAVIHCAAWTAVDLAEEDGRAELVRRVNVDGTENIALACRELGCKMVYLSTDYVFDGLGSAPWQPDCRDYRPINVYGRTKLEGEFAVTRLLEKYFIVRIAWVFGVNGTNFIKTMLKLGRKLDHIRVVSDQIGTPTYTFDLARLLADMIETEKYGFYHATNEGGYISWYEFAKEIFRQAAALGYTEYDSGRLTVTPVTTEEYGAKAKRPFNSRLDKSKLTQNGFALLPPWQDALARYLQELIRRGEKENETAHA